MKEDLDRYKRLLDDWNQGDSDAPKGNESRAQGETSPSSARPAFRAPGQSMNHSRDGESAPPGSGTPGGARSGVPRATMSPPPPEAEGAYPGGSILCLNDEELVIYRRPVSGQADHDLVYSLLADGTAKIEILNLAEFQVAEIGALPPKELRLLQERMEWDRSILLPGIRRAEDAGRIPEPDTSLRAASSATTSSSEWDAPQEPEPARGGGAPSSGESSAPAREAELPRSSHVAEPPPTAVKIESLRRGQRIAVRFGGKQWEAIYWGRDHRGYVVAHNTHKQWTLMHFDLERYKDTLTLGREPDAATLEQIAKDLRTQSQQP